MADFGKKGRGGEGARSGRKRSVDTAGIVIHHVAECVRVVPGGMG